MKRVFLLLLSCCFAFLFISCSISHVEKNSADLQTEESEQSGFLSNQDVEQETTGVSLENQDNVTVMPSSTPYANTGAEAPGGNDGACLCVKEALSGYWKAVSYIDSSGNTYGYNGADVFLCANDMSLYFQWSDGVIQNGFVEWIDYNPASAENTISVEFLEATSDDGRTTYESSVVKYTVFFKDEWQILHMRVQDTGEELVLSILDGPWN